MSKLFASILLIVGIALIHPASASWTNPGNIIKTKIKWLGETSCDRSTRFECFSSPVWGVRAMVRNLNSFYYRHGLRSVNELIGRWAPPHENQTSAYAAWVAYRLGVHPDDPLDFRKADTVFHLVNAMIRMENGMNPHPEYVIRAGILLANEL